MQYDVWRIHHGTINTQNNWKKVCQNIIIVVVVRAAHSVSKSILK